MAVIPFTVGIGPASASTPVEEVTDFENWRFVRNFDDGCTFQFTSTGRAEFAADLAELSTDIWLYRAGTLQQRFRIISINQSWDEDGNDIVDIGAFCYRRIFSTRHVRTPLSFISTSQGAIVWDLVQHAQAATGGDFGITLGDSGPTILRDREYEVGTNILQAITEFTTIEDPLAWDINGDLELIITTPQSYPIIDQPLQLGVNARQLARPSSADQFGNVTIATGDSQTTSPQFVEEPNLGVDPRGRWERLESFPSITADSELLEQAEGLLFETRSPVAQWRATMKPERYFDDSEYDIGDFVTVVQPRSTVFQIGQPAPTVLTQVIAVEVSQDANGQLEVLLSAIEQPDFGS